MFPDDCLRCQSHSCPAPAGGPTYFLQGCCGHRDCGIYPRISNMQNSIHLQLCDQTDSLCIGFFIWLTDKTTSSKARFAVGVEIFAYKYLYLSFWFRGGGGSYSPLTGLVDPRDLVGENALVLREGVRPDDPIPAANQIAMRTSWASVLLNIFLKCWWLFFYAAILFQYCITSPKEKVLNFSDMISAKRMVFIPIRLPICLFSNPMCSSTEAPQPQSFWLQFAAHATTPLRSHLPIELLAQRASLSGLEDAGTPQADGVSEFDRAQSIFFGGGDDHWWRSSHFFWRKTCTPSLTVNKFNILHDFFTLFLKYWPPLIKVQCSELIDARIEVRPGPPKNRSK